MAKVYSFWIFDRHCNPIYHQDWSHLHPSLSSATGLATVSSPTISSPTPSSLASIGATLQRAGGAVAAAAGSSSDARPLPPRRPGQPSLPGVTRSADPPQTQANKPADQRSSTGSQLAANTSTAAPAVDSDLLPFDEEAKLVYGVVFSLRNMVRKLGGSSESFNSFTTSTYTLAHLHTSTMYTFVITTDPVPPPSSIPTRSSNGYSISSARSAFGTGGGIPGTGGMSLKGVLMQIYRGPWLDAVVRNPLLTGLEREERVIDPLDDQEDDEEDLSTPTFKVAKDGKLDRLEGIDSEAFREGIERVFAQNKLSAPAS